MRIDHDRDWIIGCIQHDGFIHTHRFDKANRIILEALQTDVVRCKDCRHHGMNDCPMWDGAITEDYMWCYFGERREP